MTFSFFEYFFSPFFSSFLSNFPFLSPFLFLFWDFWSSATYLVPCQLRLMSNGRPFRLSPWRLGTQPSLTYYCWDVLTHTSCPRYSTRVPQYCLSCTQPSHHSFWVGWENIQRMSGKTFVMYLTLKFEFSSCFARRILLFQRKIPNKQIVPSWKLGCSGFEIVRSR